MSSGGGATRAKGVMLAICKPAKVAGASQPSSDKQECLLLVGLLGRRAKWEKSEGIAEIAEFCVLVHEPAKVAGLPPGCSIVVHTNTCTPIQ